MSTYAITFLAPPICMCLLLIAIHCYLGLHVLAREVVFVDLALAQVAALGTTIAYLFGFEHDSVAAYFVSLAVGLFAALFLATVNNLGKKIPQEAVIGIVYAFASSAVILLIDKISHGSEHLKYTLSGQVLWVGWKDVAMVTMIYSGVGLIHYLFRKPLLNSSYSKQSSWKYDFLFYALFTIVIVSSVKVAGILLVFAFLIVPALMGSLFYNTLKSRLLFGWLFGGALSIVAMMMSFYLDQPSSSLIVILFTMSAIATVGFTSLRQLLRK